MLEGIITDGESCRSVTDEELGSDTAISQSKSFIKAEHKKSVDFCMRKELYLLKGKKAVDGCLTKELHFLKGEK